MKKTGYPALIGWAIWPPGWTWTVLCIAWFCMWHRVVGTVKRIDRGP